MKRVKDIFSSEAEAINRIPVNGFYEDAINAIYRKVHIDKGKVITSGMGKAGQIAMNISTTLSSTGTPAVFLHPSEAQHGDLGVIQENDILLVISNSGKTREILELLVLVNNLFKNIPVIVITSDSKSDLAEKADYLLLTGNPDEVCSLGLTPTTSTTVMTVIGDAIVVLLQEKIGFTMKEYAKRHHGGYLGMKSRGEDKKYH